MNFELPDTEHASFEPMRESTTRELKSESNWKVNLEALEKLVEGNENLTLMLEDVLEQCLLYTKSVLEHIQTTDTQGYGEESEIASKQRSITHDATRDTIRAFVRNLLKSGKTEEEVLAVLPHPDSRAACGQFALRLTLSRSESLVE